MRWSEADTATLLAMAGKVSAVEIAARLGRTKQAIYNRCFELGIKNRPWSPPSGHPWRNPLRWTDEQTQAEQGLKDRQRRLARRRPVADITMCKGGGHDLCLTCHRRTATPNDFVQAYFTDVPADAEGNCEFWLPQRGQE